MSPWKQGSLTNQPSTGVFARSLELHLDTGEEPMRQCRRGSSGLPTIEAGASCASVRREIRCFHSRSRLAKAEIDKTRHFRSRHGCNSGKTMVCAELATKALFEWRAHAGACHVSDELLGTQLGPWLALVTAGLGDPRQSPLPKFL